MDLFCLLRRPIEDDGASALRKCRAVVAQAHAPHREKRARVHRREGEKCTAAGDAVALEAGKEPFMAAWRCGAGLLSFNRAQSVPQLVALY